MGTIITFGVSLAALVAFCAFKLLERTRDIPVYTSFRRKGDVVVMTVVTWLQHHRSRLEDELSARAVIQKTTHFIATAIAKAARQVEMRAHDVTRKMSRNGFGKPGTKSSFLQEVSIHKRGLDTDRVKRETSLTDDEYKQE